MHSLLIQISSPSLVCLVSCRLSLMGVLIGLSSLKAILPFHSQQTKNFEKKTQPEIHIKSVPTLSLSLRSPHLENSFSFFFFSLHAPIPLLSASSLLDFFLFLPFLLELPFLNLSCLKITLYVLALVYLR